MLPKRAPDHRGSDWFFFTGENWLVFPGEKWLFYPVANTGTREAQASTHPYRPEGHSKGPFSFSSSLSLLSTCLIPLCKFSLESLKLHLTEAYQ